MSSAEATSSQTNECVRPRSFAFDAFTRMCRYTAITFAMLSPDALAIVRHFGSVGMSCHRRNHDALTLTSLRSAPRTGDSCQDSVRGRRGSVVVRIAERSSCLSCSGYHTRPLRAVSIVLRIYRSSTRSRCKGASSDPELLREYDHFTPRQIGNGHRGRPSSLRILRISRRAAGVGRWRLRVIGPSTRKRGRGQDYSGPRAGPARPPRRSERPAGNSSF